MQTAHKKKLDAQDELICLLKEMLRMADGDDNKCPELLRLLKKQRNNGT